MMQKSVRYHITEAEDRPVVRTVSVAIRQEPNDDQHVVETQVDTQETNHLDSRRARFRERLKSARHHDYS